MLFAFVYLLFSCAQATPLVIGTVSDDYPFSFYADQKHHYYGFEIDLMNGICQQLKIECIFKPILASQVINSLTNNKVHLVIGAQIIPIPNLNSALIFSLPYLPSYARFIAKKESPINTIKDIRDKRVGIRLGSLFGGTLFKDYVRNMYKDEVTTFLYLSMNDLLFGLENDQIDVAFSNDYPIEYWYTNNPDHFKLIGDKMPIGNGYGIVGKKGEEDLMAHINHFLISMTKDGSYEKLYNRYFNLE